MKEEDNDAFLTLLEEYFASSDGIRDARPDLSYQVGVTPAMIEKPRAHCSTFEALPDKPFTICPPEADPKWRFFWRIVSTWHDTFIYMRNEHPTCHHFAFVLVHSSSSPVSPGSHSREVTLPTAK